MHYGSDTKGGRILADFNIIISQRERNLLTITPYGDTEVFIAPRSGLFIYLGAVQTGVGKSEYFAVVAGLGGLDAIMYFRRTWLLFRQEQLQGVEATVVPDEFIQKAKDWYQKEI